MTRCRDGYENVLVKKVDTNYRKEPLSFGYQLRRYLINIQKMASDLFKLAQEEGTQAVDAINEVAKDCPNRLSMR